MYLKEKEGKRRKNERDGKFQIHHLPIAIFKPLCRINLTNLSELSDLFKFIKKLYLNFQPKITKDYRYESIIR